MPTSHAQVRAQECMTLFVFFVLEAAGELSKLPETEHCTTAHTMQPAQKKSCTDAPSHADREEQDRRARRGARMNELLLAMDHASGYRFTPGVPFMLSETVLDEWVAAAEAYVQASAKATK